MTRRVAYPPECIAFECLGYHCEGAQSFYRETGYVRLYGLPRKYIPVMPVGLVRPLTKSARQLLALVKR